MCPLFGLFFFLSSSLSILSVGIITATRSVLGRPTLHHILCVYCVTLLRNSGSRCRRSIVRSPLLLAAWRLGCSLSALLPVRFRARLMTSTMTTFGPVPAVGWLVSYRALVPLPSRTTRTAISSTGMATCYRIDVRLSLFHTRSKQKETRAKTGGTEKGGLWLCNLYHYLHLKTMLYSLLVYQLVCVCLLSRISGSIYIYIYN